MPRSFGVVYNRALNLLRRSRVPPEPFVNLGFGEAGDFDHLPGGGVARRHAYAPIGDAESGGDGRFDSGVRLAAFRRRGDADFEYVVEPALDRIPRRRWNDLDAQLDGRLSHPRNHDVTRPGLMESLQGNATRRRASPRTISSPARRRTPREPVGTVMVRPLRMMSVPCTLPSSWSR